jgi:hypothetical protein
MNLEQLSLYFSEFSTICYRFLKFTILKIKIKRNETFHRGLWKDLRLANRSLAGLGAGEAAAGRFPARNRWKNTGCQDLHVCGLDWG